MNNLPNELICAISKHNRLYDFYKLRSICKRYYKFIDDNHDYLIKIQLNRWTFYGLLRQAIDNNQLITLIHLLAYFVKHLLHKFIDSLIEPATSGQLDITLSTRIFNIAIKNKNIEILELLMQIGKLFRYEFSLSIADICVSQEIFILSCHILNKYFGKCITNMIYFITRWNNIQIENKDIGGMDRSYHTEIIKLALSYNRIDIITKILLVDIHYIQSYKNFDELYFILDYIMVDINDSNIIRNLLNLAISSHINHVRNAIVLSTLKHKKVSICDFDWKLMSNINLYLECTRHTPKDEILTVIRENMYHNEGVFSYNIQDIPIDIIMEIMDYVIYKMNTKITLRNTNIDQFITQLKNIKNQEYPYNCISINNNFALLYNLIHNKTEGIDYVSNVDELLMLIQPNSTNILYPVSINYIGERYPQDKVDFISKFLKYNKNPVKLNNHINLDKIIPCLINFIIDSDDINLYLKLRSEIIEYFIHLNLTCNIFISVSFHSKKMENLFLVDNRDNIINFINTKMDENFLIKRYSLYDEVDINDYAIHIDSIRSHTKNKLLDMSGLNIDSYWWKDYISCEF